jgi:hypothetical protein
MKPYLEQCTWQTLCRKVPDRIGKSPFAFYSISSHNKEQPTVSPRFRIYPVLEMISKTSVSIGCPHPYLVRSDLAQARFLPMCYVPSALHNRPFQGLISSLMSFLWELVGRFFRSSVKFGSDVVAAFISKPSTQCHTSMWDSIKTSVWSDFQVRR